jgi:hypothetical protein
VPEEGVIYAVARDVTERVRLENDLEKSHREMALRQTSASATPERAS